MFNPIRFWRWLVIVLFLLAALIVVPTLAQETVSLARARIGYQALKDWLQRQTSLRVAVCLEATGRYGEAVALFLHQQGYPVSVVNPAPVKYFAAALNKRHKTDQSDAQVLALYLAQMHPPSWQPPDQTQPIFRS